ncbi:polysaccharide deacetylase family protein [uncultured Clostridium sp.]|uniref:polysaccharide deacetylase family protein n=1 Tax=uncultured Clostridium sp. TaxID=59620 RepID=UPI0028EADE27|nr:polysaccharide deacetylase family protein [uncultured Clostridium sp.]
MKKRHKILIAILIVLFVLPVFLNRSYSKDQGKLSIPVLMYHSISNDEKGLFSVKKDTFYEHMKYLKDNNYETLTLEELYNHLTNEIPFSDKSVVITFDDGYADNYVNAYPILKEFGLKATIFQITNYIDSGSSFLNSDQLKELSSNGIDIESHTTDHSKLAKLSKDDRLKKLKESKDLLEKLLDKKVDYIAYPFGKYNKEVIEDVKEAGYKMVFTTRMGFSNINNGLYELKRVFISGYTGIERFEKRIRNEFEEM